MSLMGTRAARRQASSYYVANNRWGKTEMPRSLPGRIRRRNRGILAADTVSDRGEGTCSWTIVMDCTGGGGDVPAESRSHLMLLGSWGGHVSSNRLPVIRYKRK
jgi:hypothetical protein